jgi:hypothetical protein
LKVLVREEYIVVVVVVVVVAVVEPFAVAVGREKQSVAGRSGRKFG